MHSAIIFIFTFVFLMVSGTTDYKCKNDAQQDGEYYACPISYNLTEDKKEEMTKGGLITYEEQTANLYWSKAMNFTLKKTLLVHGSLFRGIVLKYKMKFIQTTCRKGDTKREHLSKCNNTLASALPQVCLLVWMEAPPGVFFSRYVDHCGQRD